MDLERTCGPEELALRLRARVLEVVRGGALGGEACLRTPEGLEDPALARLVDLTPRSSWLELVGDLRRVALELDGPVSRILARRLDDLPRRTAFEVLEEARGSPEREREAVSAVQRVLGPAPRWASAFRRAISADAAHLVVVLTWDCETRCTYCGFTKQPGRVMTPEVLDEAIELLLSSDRSERELRFFGGEPLMQWERVQHGIERATARAGERGVRFMISTNGWSLSESRLRWLAGRPVRLQVALEGGREAQNRLRVPLDPTQDSYTHSAAPHAALLRELELEHDLIWVVSPASVEGMEANFAHLLELGFPRIQLNWAHGQMWSEARRHRFASGLNAVAATLRERWARGLGPWLVNLEETLARVRTFREPVVDWDGTVLANNGFLFRPEHREPLTLGHLRDPESYDRYRFDGLSDARLLELTFPAAVAENNAQVGAIMNSFVLWMRREGLPGREIRSARR